MFVFEEHEDGGLSGRCERAEAKLLSAQSELAALREELAELKDQLASTGEDVGQLRSELEDAESDNETIAEHNIELQQRLTAAEQRNADMLNWLRRQANAEKGSTERSVFIESYNALKKIAETKPTESGASENKCCDRFPKCACYEGADGL